jgi:aspartyl protease family protein
MRAVLSIAVAALVACAIVPYYTNQILTSEGSTAALAAHRSVPARPEVKPQVKPDVSASRSVVIAPGSGGHFRVAGRIDGRRVNFMVDTGASVIALTARDAATLGIHPAERDYIAMVKTANGAMRVAPVELDMVEIDDLEVHNVAAVVLPPGVLNENLLGLSFLSRLRRFEYTDGKLVLEQ